MMGVGREGGRGSKIRLPRIYQNAGPLENFDPIRRRSDENVSSKLLTLVSNQTKLLLYPGPTFGAKTHRLESLTVRVRPRLSIAGQVITISNEMGGPSYDFFHEHYLFLL